MDTQNVKEVIELINRRLLVIDYLSQLSQEECQDLIDEVHEFTEEAQAMHVSKTERYLKKVDILSKERGGGSGISWNYYIELLYNNGQKVKADLDNWKDI